MKVFLIYAALCFAGVYGDKSEEHYSPLEDNDISVPVSPQLSEEDDLSATRIFMNNNGNGIPLVYDYKFGEKCPAEEFYKDCNRCHCIDGYYAACTRKGCSRRRKESVTISEFRNGVPVVYGYKIGDKCPAEEFYNDCNECHCFNGYSAACTRMGCFERQKRSITNLKLRNGLPVVYDYKFGDKCPAKQFYNDCNRCSCYDGYSASCTRMMCPSQSLQIPAKIGGTSVHRYGLPIVHHYKNGEKCPAQQFYNDCNRCACGKDGHSAACTRMACSPGIML